VAITTDGGGESPTRPPPLLLVFSITLTAILGNTLINAPLPDILIEFGLPESAAGTLVAAATLPGIVLAPVIGLMADRFGRRTLLVPCLTVFGIGGVLASFAPTFGALLACRLLQGVGSAGLINLAVVVIADNWTGAERTRLIGYNAAVLTVSLAIFPAVGGLLDQAGGWRWSFAPYGLALVTALAVLHWLPRDIRRVTSSLGDQLRAAAGAFRQPVVFGSMAFGFVLFALIFGLFLTAMPILLAHSFAMGPRDRGLLLSAPALTSTIAAVSLGRVRVRLGASRLLLGANVMFVIGFLTIGLAGAVGIVALGALIYGLGEGSSIPTVQDLVASRAPEQSRGAVVAIWVGSARAGQTVGPLLAAVSLAHIGASATFVAGAGVTATLLVAQIVGRRVIDFSPPPG
jgi:ACDE family multidrug resistance protein